MVRWEPCLAVRNKVEEERLRSPGDGVAVTKHHQDRLPPGLEAVPGRRHVGCDWIILQKGNQQRPPGSSGLEERRGEGGRVGRQHLWWNIVLLEGEPHQFGDWQVATKQQDGKPPQQERQ